MSEIWMNASSPVNIHDVTNYAFIYMSGNSQIGDRVRFCARNYSKFKEKKD